MSVRNYGCITLNILKEIQTLIHLTLHHLATRLIPVFHFKHCSYFYSFFFFFFLVLFFIYIYVFCSQAAKPAGYKVRFQKHWKVLHFLLFKWKRNLAASGSLQCFREQNNINAPSKTLKLKLKAILSELSQCL